jgi:hypothetical protein
MGHPKIFLRVGAAGSFLSQLAAGKSAARDDKGEGDTSKKSGCRTVMRVPLSVHASVVVNPVCLPGCSPVIRKRLF